MINFGLIDEWEPSPGRVTSWVASLASVAAAGHAPTHPVGPSYQQEAYLRAAQRHEDAGFRFGRLCLLAFEIQGELDVEAMTRAINVFLRRHDTFLSWFSMDDDEITRHVIDPSIVDFVPTDSTYISSSQDIREHVEAQTPGPFNWDCFTLGTIEHDGRFVVYLAADHLNSDGISQALSCVDLMSAYQREISTDAPELMPVGSYIDFCRRERDISRELTLETPQVRKWIELLEENDGELPHFPLDLGLSTADYNRSAFTTVDLMTPEQAERVDIACHANGAGFAAGVLAIAGLVSHEFTNRTKYFGFTPKNTRSTASEFASVGWFTNLIPVCVDITDGSSFTSIVEATQQSFNEGKTMSEVSLHRVLELVPQDSTISIPAGWSVPMVSYLDVRKLPGGDMFDKVNFSVFGNRGSSEEVFIWVNRFPEGTKMSFLYPRTDEAETSIKLYVDRMLEIFSTIAATGDYVPSVAVLAK
ncbi:condensation domain-containing protein [Williamsia phyllosphaerae]|uniref:Conserved polyketide synthase associated protein PapA2 n=1 Tax=Williamsia phyllosphaerae TaxID=885042 RepID=A0ABQ1V5H5_9NOCA|nr:condensation domain-containing protein [Williamsia phyllosphaerae]GGF39748.1 putative conserved polyketide synthase associated protein PapA2 [Williamsia phyllosphaerae]